MDQFRTIVSSSQSGDRIGLKDPILTLGSCFSDAIGEKLRSNKFNTMVNPFGVIYNPISIHSVLELAAANNTLQPHTFLRHSDISLNYMFHSQFGALDQHILEERLTTVMQNVRSYLASSRWIMITYGTSFVYTRKDTGEVVANCHKQPSQLFTKSLLTHEAILESFSRLYDLLMKVNPAIKIILTVSPVRHLKDSLSLNSVSKSILRTSCHYLQEKFVNVQYFPAYELMIDDLRDYRFYAGDMIHPNEQAEAYIWEHFQKTFFNEDIISFIANWQKILASLHHKPFHPASAGHQIFLQQLLQKLQGIAKSVDVETEIRSVQQKLLYINQTLNPHDH